MSQRKSRHDSFKKDALRRLMACGSKTIGEIAQDFLVSNYGFLYGANIIDAWTTPLGAHDADVYWNMSTWDPTRRC
jgi:hypothetical protein